MSTLTLELLGAPRLLSPEGEILLSNGLPVALLAYLALEDRPISRDHLSELFWPGLERRRQLHNLRQALHRLRSVHPQEVIQGDGELGIRPGALTTDVSRFLALLSEGRVQEGVALWRGPFLYGFRRPRSWELEDWIDRRRNLLEAALVEGATEEARRQLEADAPAAALSLLETPRRLVPDHEELGALQVVVLARLGRRIEAEGILKSLELEPGSELEVEARDALAAAHRTVASGPAAVLSEGTIPELAPSFPGPGAHGESEIGAAGAFEEPELGSAGEGQPEAAGVFTEPELGAADAFREPQASHAPPFDSTPPTPAPPEPPTAPPSRIRPAFRLGPWLIGASVVLLLSVAGFRRFSARTTIRANEEAGFSLLVCANWGTAETFLQPYRMSPGGADKHRLSEADLCQSAWVEEAGALFGPVPDRSPESRLVRLTPHPRNPIAEWDQAEVESARHLRAPRIPRGNPKAGPGGVLVFSAEDEEGNRDIYALETRSERLSRLTTSPAVDEWPTVDPEGDRVIFSSHRSGDGDLYSVKLDGSGLTRLTDHPLRDWRPWVRGDSVLFVRGMGMGVEDGDMELVILDLADGSEAQLTDNDWNDYEQMWSPDGRYLCWQSERLGHFESDIMVLDLVRDRRWNATGTPGRESDCRWTGTGNGLLYIRFMEEGSDVFLQSLRGGPPINLTRYPGHESVVGYFRVPGAGA